MRIAFTALGSVLIVVYAILGAMLMNAWSVAASSGLPLDTTIAEMRAAGQPYSPVPGFVFAGLGVLLAFAWAALTLHPRVRLTAWGSLVVWGGVVALGAPAYFLASFGNMNSVGDAFLEGNADAAFALERPLYLASWGAFVLAVGALVALIASAARRSTRPAGRLDA